MRNGTEKTRSNPNDGSSKKTSISEPETKKVLLLCKGMKYEFKICRSRFQNPGERARQPESTIFKKTSFLHERDTRQNRTTPKQETLSTLNLSVKFPNTINLIVDVDALQLFGLERISVVG